jgi:phage FluMu protein Com
MKTTYAYVRSVYVEDACPKCGQVSETDVSKVEDHEFPMQVGFWCHGCDYEWEKELPHVPYEEKEDK